MGTGLEIGFTETSKFHCAYMTESGFVYVRCRFPDCACVQLKHSDLANLLQCATSAAVGSLC